MRRAAVAVTAAGAVLLLLWSVGARTEDEPTPVPTASGDAATTANATALLRSGTEFIDRTSFRVDSDIASQVTARIHTDVVHKRAVAVLSAANGVIEIRMIDTELYMTSTLDPAGVGRGWMRLDPVRVPSDFAPSFAAGRNDPGGSARLIDAVVSAQADGSHITGTLDVNRIGIGIGLSFRPGPGGSFPESARSHAFHASLDAEGRLVSFLMPAADGLPNASLRYSDFGVSLEVIRPEGAVAAPDALYPQLGVGG
ncbi:hypothetical protein [Micromonospora sp. 067-2]|uniref:hypothetical protein n=1 Tax=Micromonospora sp. 067-2 TaxID=2789270 RepID=UPI00397E1D9A